LSQFEKLTGEDLSSHLNKSPLPLTDPRDAMAQRMLKLFRTASYGNQTISFTRPSCCVGLQISQRWVWSTVLSDDHQKFMILTSELRWQRLWRSTVPEICLMSTKS